MREFAQNYVEVGYVRIRADSARRQILARVRATMSLSGWLLSLSWLAACSLARDEELIKSYSVEPVAAALGE